MHPSGFGSFWILLLIMMLSAWSRSSLLTGQARPALRSLPALIHTLRPVASRLALQPHHGGQAPLLPPPLEFSPTGSGPFLLPSSRVPVEEDVNDHKPPLPIFVPATSAASRLSPGEEPFDRPRDDDGQDPAYVQDGTAPDDSLPDAKDLVNSWAPGELSLIQQMTRKSRAAIAVLSSLIAYVSINSLVRTLNPSAFIWYEEDKDEPRWIASSSSWFDRKACRWLGLCGASHFRLVRTRFGYRKEDAEPSPDEGAPWRSSWTEGKNNPEEWSDDERVLREIPDYVLEYAPLVHLFSGEQFWPCDIAEHLYHTTPMLNYTPVQSTWEHRTLSDLDQLNQWEDGRNVFLTSNDNVEDRPTWLAGEKNIPDDGNGEHEEAWADWDGRIDGKIPGDTEEERAKWYDVGEGSPLQEGGDRADAEGVDGRVPADTVEEEDYVNELRKRYGGKEIRADGPDGGRSDAPAVLIVVDKGHGVVDAFWFYFYSFNLGNVVLNVRFGNHVGDWEHSLVRFYNGKPKAMFFSAHSTGEAYSYEAVEKIGKRPVIYSAVGTHAMYATPGTHSYILPLGLLHDKTDRGPLWDPLLNAHAYTYDYLNDTLRASNITPNAPTEWFYFNGHWGDKFYPLNDRRQYRIAGQYHYVNGPLGPRFKNLGRRKVCQGSAKDPCVIKNYIGDGKRARRWTAAGPGEELTEADLQMMSAKHTAADEQV